MTAEEKAAGEFMRKFLVVSGFLGSVKTTTMMALTNHLNQTGKKAAMISNDLGRKGLADYRYSRAAGVVSEEISGECICFVTEDLVERLRRLCRDDGCEMIISGSARWNTYTAGSGSSIRMNANWRRSRS